MSAPTLREVVGRIVAQGGNIERGHAVAVSIGTDTFVDLREAWAADEARERAVEKMVEALKTCKLELSYHRKNDMGEEMGAAVEAFNNAATALSAYHAATGGAS